MRKSIHASMDLLTEIKRLSDNSGLLQFSEFILAQVADKGLPDYENLDLMEVPKLVPHIFVFDVLKSPDKLRIKYCGTVLDEIYGTNMMGKCVFEFYNGRDSFEEIESLFREAIATKTPCYTRRAIHLKNKYVDKYRIAESILFPCSSVDGVVNFTVGFGDYYVVPEEVDKSTTLVLLR